jgi:ABC-type proline/glycine betaine transport system substrate-binding protein
MKKLCALATLTAALAALPLTSASAQLQRSREVIQFCSWKWSQRLRVCGGELIRGTLGGKHS